ncbi:MAG: NAD(P)/FAD-dependent oxidoreductase, partial [Candidatus Aenigmarchaeota archaeon]|nr:NAD(P)/FAD-dependent oxidoreductase [Candidatus Aenigmarchaeota archaeon]
MLSPFNIKEKYNVLVIGAGPGGCRVAQLCAKEGLSVLILEKRPEIGVPKRCAEGIEKNQLLNLGFDENEKFIAQTIAKSVVYVPSGEKIISNTDKKEGCILERKLFDKAMASKAAICGAKILVNTEVLNLIKENDYVCGVNAEYCGKTYSIKSDIVVSAEGVEAKRANEALDLSPPKSNEIMSGYQYEMENIDLKDPHQLEFFIGATIAPGGYIWIFPKGERRANVGIGIVSDCEKSAKYYLDAWISNKSSLQMGSILEENAGAIPVGGFLKKMTANGFLAIGDAARQVHPLHGGGLHEATHAAKIAAQVIYEAKSENNYSDKFLDKYNKMWWNERGKELSCVNKIKNAFQKMSDEELNLIFHLIKATSINHLNSGNLIEIS